MGIIVWVLRAAWSLVWLLVKWIFRFSARSTKKAIQASQGFVLEQTKEYERKSAPITSENWYDKASMICGETVDALMNEKTGTSERIVRSLAAKLGFSGAAAGLFSIASVFGTASTGTAISTLSGAAFNSAALKWIGGGVSMAVGGWVVFLISFVVGVLSYVAAILTFRKFKGTKRKLKNLDSQEKRVVETLMLISIGFRAQADQQRRLDPVSAAIIKDKVFEMLSGELQKCADKVRHWPTFPREQLRKKIGQMSELHSFLRKTAQSGGDRLRIVSGAERADIVPVVVLKLMSDPIPALNSEETLVLEALRRTNKKKLKKASLDIVAEYVRLQRIDHLTAQLEKARRIYRKLATRPRSSCSDEYTVAFVEEPERAGVTVLVQNLRTGEASMSKIQEADHRRLFDESESSQIGDRTTSNGSDSENVLNGSVIIPEINRLENWTSPALIIDGDENEEIEIYRAADPGDPETGRKRRACA